MKPRIAVILFIAALLSSCSSQGQPADPGQLAGTWSGHWGPSPERQTEVVLELKWDGKALTGTINPGSRAMELSQATFDPKTSMTHMEVDVPTPGGENDHYAIDGKVAGKTMTGTWTRRNGRGDFNITKN
jgi:hypothetical protein